MPPVRPSESLAVRVPEIDVASSSPVPEISPPNEVGSGTDVMDVDNATSDCEKGVSPPFAEIFRTPEVSSWRLFSKKLKFAALFCTNASKSPSPSKSP